MKELKIKMKEKSSNKFNKFICFQFKLSALIILMTACDPVVKSTGPFSSPSINESKKRNVFLWEYVPSNIQIIDSLDLDIHEVFAENRYKYYSYSDLRYKTLKNKSQIRINFKTEPFQKGYHEKWLLKDFHGTSPNGLLMVINEELPPDSLSVKILKVDTNEQGGAGENHKKEIGTFTLYRKYP